MKPATAEAKHALLNIAYNTDFVNKNAVFLHICIVYAYKRFFSNIYANTP